MQQDLIEKWTLCKDHIPYDVDCELRQRRGSYVGKFDAHPMSEVTRSNWIGDVHHFDGVKAISTNTHSHINEYTVALTYKSTDLAKSIINDVAEQMMWVCYPNECYDLYYSK